MARARSKVRPFTWVIIVVNVLFLIWIVAGLASTGDTCNDATEFREACEDGAAVGAGIAIFLIVLFAAAVNVILGVIWLVTRKSGTSAPVAAPQAAVGQTRTCPYCAETIQRAAMVCKHCARDVPPAARAVHPEGACQECGEVIPRPRPAFCLRCKEPLPR